MNKQKNLSGEERKKTKEVLRQYLEKERAILFAYLHGSFAEGRPFRDIDIAVFVDEKYIPRGKGLDFEMSVSMGLEAVVGLPIDVKVINYAPLAFQYFSTSGTLLIDKEDDFRTDFLTKIRSLYFDFKPSSERFLREMLHAE